MQEYVVLVFRSAMLRNMAMPLIASIKADVKFLTLQFGTPAEEYIACLKAHPEVVVRKYLPCPE